MINFRYHVISLVAVFLALGLGIVMGSTVIDRAIVDGLRNRIDNAEKNSIQRKTENDRLNSYVSHQNAQDTVLAGHVVNDTLTGQTVFVMTVGSVPNQTLVETQELLGISGARLGSVINFNANFLKEDKNKVEKDLHGLDNVKTLLGDSKDKDKQIATVINEYFNLRAGGTSSAVLPIDQISSVFDKDNVFTETEKATNFDPAEPVSFILLVNRTDLDDARLASFTSELHTSFPLTIGLVGSDTDKPSRSDSINKFGNTITSVAVVDNAETPSGRAALLVAHAQNITGSHVIYGVSSKAKSPAPPVP